MWTIQCKIHLSFFTLSLVEEVSSGFSSIRFSLDCQIFLFHSGTVKGTLLVGLSKNTAFYCCFNTSSTYMNRITCLCYPRSRAGSIWDAQVLRRVPVKALSVMWSTSRCLDTLSTWHHWHLPCCPVRVNDCPFQRQQDAGTSLQAVLFTFGVKSWLKHAVRSGSLSVSK